jgi:hypothetical protein
MNKNKIIAILIALVTTILILLVILLPKGVPTSGEIFDKADKYWQARKFSKLRVYIEDINKTYPDYIPAIVASAVSESQSNIDYKESVKIFDGINDYVFNNYVYVSPIFVEFIENQLKTERHNLETFNKFLAKGKISRAARMKRFAPENQESSPYYNHFDNEVNFFNIPNAFISTNEIIYLPLPKELQDNGIKIRESDNELRDIVFDYEGKMVKREKARNKLVMKRYQNGGITNLFQGFSSKESAYMSLATSQKLYLIGEESLPNIVVFLNSKKVRECDMVLWAIMMMQYNGLSKEKTLEYVNQIDDYYFEKSEYARRVREFLQTD